MPECLVIDTEVSSLKTNECIQLAYADTLGITGNHRFSPSKDGWEYGAIATHHILPSDVEGCEPSASAVYSLPDSDYVVGHNVDFDCLVLGGLPGRKRICTLAMARAQWPELPSHKLAALAYMVLGVTDATRSIVKNSHDAMVDVYLCEQILRAIVKERNLPQDWDAIFQSSEADRIPKTMPFGKHIGLRLGELPADYVKWLLKLNDLDPYLRKALTR
jgi:exodeoxyribonuclease X